MSGGHWDYRNDYLAEDIFGWHMSPNYGEKGFSQSAMARKLNPLEDKLISELVWDVLCLLHSYDWYISADCSEKSYREDVAYFKDKWFGGRYKSSTVKKIINEDCENLRKELLQMFGVNE